MSPGSMDWSDHYPAYKAAEAEDHQSKNANVEDIPRISKQVEVADIGCGFGGLLFALAPKLPDTLVLGRLTS